MSIIGEFQVLLSYARNLQFEEDPNYSYTKNLLEKVFNRYNFSYDSKFDWNITKNKRIVFPEYKPLTKPQDNPE